MGVLLRGAREEDRQAPIDIEIAEIDVRHVRVVCRRAGARVCRCEAEIDFEWRGAIEPGVRCVRSVIAERGLEAGGQIGARERWTSRHGHQALQRAPEALDTRRGPRRADGAEPVTGAESAEWTGGTGPRRIAVGVGGHRGDRRQRRMVSRPILTPARASVCAMRRLPPNPHASICDTRSRTTSLYRRSGGAAFSSTPTVSRAGSTVASRIHRAMVLTDTRNRSAASAHERP